jgi:hypothetical protein
VIGPCRPHQAPQRPSAIDVSSLNHDAHCRAIRWPPRRRQRAAQRRGLGPEGDKLHGRVVARRSVVEMAPRVDCNTVVDGRPSGPRPASPARVSAISWSLQPAQAGRRCGAGASQSERLRAGDVVKRLAGATLGGPEHADEHPAAFLTTVTLLRKSSWASSALVPREPAEPADGGIAAASGTLALALVRIVSTGDLDSLLPLCGTCGVPLARRALGSVVVIDAWDPHRWHSFEMMFARRRGRVRSHGSSSKHFFTRRQRPTTTRKHDYKLYRRESGDVSVEGLDRQRETWPSERVRTGTIGPLAGLMECFARSTGRTRRSCRSRRGIRPGIDGWCPS